MEGPSLYLLKEEAALFIGKKVLHADGYGKIDIPALEHKTVKDITCWGKHFLIVFSGFAIRVHFGLFGNYRINDHKKGVNASLHLQFANGELSCYIAHLKILTGPLNKIYDWRLDMLSRKWDPKYVKKILMQQNGDRQIGDLLLDPDLFTGVGNIIRNEVLYRCKVHPASLLKKVPSAKLTAIIRATHDYSVEFLKALPQHRVSKTWQIYGKKECIKGHKITKRIGGKTKRNIFACAICQEKYK